MKFYSPSMRFEFYYYFCLTQSSKYFSWSCSKYNNKFKSHAVYFIITTYYSSNLNIYLIDLNKNNYICSLSGKMLTSIL